MTMPAGPNQVTDRELLAVTGERIPVPDPNRLVHLQFRRFAGVRSATCTCAPSCSGTTT